MSETDATVAATETETIEDNGSAAPVDVPPQPAVDPDTAGFWAATARGELALCRCQVCRTWLQPPMERCRVCGGPTAYEQVTGDGTIYSFIVVNRPSTSGYAEQVPYAVALVELDEQPGLRLSARLVGVDPHGPEVAIGTRVRAEIVGVPGGPFHVPVFRPRGAAG